jgi:hypothetical protein
MRVYDLESSDLENLGPARAVHFFRKLLWNESTRVGIGRNLIDFPDCINVGDGGLDSVIENAESLFDDVIPSGFSGFQVKSSDLLPEKCRKELHEREDLEAPLKPEIERLLDNNGTYILVIFADITDRAKRNRETAIRDELEEMGYRNSKIRVYTINQIMGFAERSPSLVAWQKRYPIECLPYEKWAESTDVSSPRTFVLDEQRDRIIKEIREKLRFRGDSSPVFRITGLSGLGKTRLTFEVLAPDGLRNSAIYVRAEEFRNSTLLNTLAIDDNLEGIIVVDDCPLEDHDYFVRNLSGRGPRMALITVSYDMRDCPPPAFPYQLKPLPLEKVKDLLSKEIKGLPLNLTHRLAEFADGYPGVAILLSESYLSSGSDRDDILAVNDEILINRLITGSDDSHSEFSRKTKRALMGIALFEKVGYRGNLSLEARWVADLMRVEWHEFQQIVKEQKKRGIIQGEYYICVTPFFLAAYLVREWWETHGYDLNLEEFLQGMPAESRSEMMDRFFSRFPYITATEPGRKLVKQLLSDTGILADASLLKTKLGARLFLKLADADPESALNCLKRTIGTWNEEELFDFRTGRREVVWALQKMVMRRELFADAARLLLALGEAENEDYSNSASEVFADFFSPARGLVAPTEASPMERWPVLMEAINSSSVKRKKLALKAFRKALKSGNFTRTMGAEFQGSGPLPDLWNPQTYGEVLDYYRKAWQYLENNIEEFEDEIREEVVDVLLEAARGISILNPSLSEMVVATMRRMASYTWLDKKRVLSVVSRIVHYDGGKMPESNLKKWISLRDELTGSTFSDLLKRYVQMGIIEDYYHDGKKYDENWVESKIKELAEIAVENPEMLESEYSWLTKRKARRGYQFGYMLGKLDMEFSLLHKLINEQMKAVDGSVYFLGGYFRALFERNTPLWEKTLDELSEVNSLKKLIPELTWHSGMTDRAAERILSMTRRGDTRVDDFEVFRFGRVIEKISEPIFIEWIKYLLREPSNTGAVIALNLVDSYYVFEKKERPLPKEVILEVLLHPALWKTPEKIRGNQMADYHWKMVGSALIDQYPETGAVLAEQILQFFGSNEGLVSGPYTETPEVLLEIARKNPREIWRKVEKYLGPPIDTRAFHLKEWLRGEKGLEEKGALECFDPEDIWQWVQADVENRAWYLATFVPPILFHSEDNLCFARELLIRYGDREDVRDNFSANYSTELWRGSMSNHYSGKREYLLEFKREETDENVVRWIDEYIERLEGSIERARMEEERRGF